MITILKIQAKLETTSGVLDHSSLIGKPPTNTPYKTLGTIRYSRGRATDLVAIKVHCIQRRYNSGGSKITTAGGPYKAIPIKAEPGKHILGG